jgi:hypothetical protein
MKRLDYTRRIRTVPGHARNAAEAVMYLAHVARERFRLEQERKSLTKRIQKIEVRLTQIAGTENKLAPTMQLPSQRPGEADVPLPAAMTARPRMLPAGVTQVTLQY